MSELSVKTAKLVTLGLMSVILLMAIIGSAYAIFLFLGYPDLSGFLFPYASSLVRFVGYAVDVLIVYTIATTASTKRTRLRLEQLWKPRLVQLVEQTQARMNVSKPVKASIMPRVANAGYAGRNRILVGEKLLSNMDDQELVGVIGHELAHGIKHHIIPRISGTIAVFSAVILEQIYIGSNAQNYVLLTTLFAVITFATIPVWWRIEYSADRTAADLLGPTTLIRTLSKLRTLTFDGISFTHPPAFTANPTNGRHAKHSRHS